MVIYIFSEFKNFIIRIIFIIPCNFNPFSLVILHSIFNGIIASYFTNEYRSGNQLIPFSKMSLFESCTNSNLASGRRTFFMVLCKCI